MAHDDILPPLPEFEERRQSPGRRSYDHVSLQYYLERLLREMDRRLDRLDDALEKLASRQAGYVTQSYYDSHHDELMQRIGRVDRWISNIQGRAVAIGVIGGVVIAVTAGVIGHALNQAF